MSTKYSEVEIIETEMSKWIDRAFKAERSIEKVKTMLLSGAEILRDDAREGGGRISLQIFETYVTAILSFLPENRAFEPIAELPY